jgi:hypothetical protein
MEIKMTGNVLRLISIVCGIIACACQSDNKDSNSLEYFKEFARAEVTIERLRKQDSPDWKAIQQQYAVCSTLVKEIDEKKNTNYHGAILDAIAKCAINVNARVNQQILAKGLQHVAVMQIRDSLHSMANADAKSRKRIAKHIAALFEGIRPTFIRRDADYFSGQKHLEKEADLALAALKSGIEADTITAATRLEGIINRTYALCVLFEMQSIEKLRETDLAKCEVKLAEAVIFYRIIETRINKTDRKAHQTIGATLNAEFSTVNSELLLDALNRGLSINIL